MKWRIFPIIFQHDSMQCGIACLQMVCKFYGRNYNNLYLSSICHASREGVSLLAISETAIRIGFHTICTSISENKNNKYRKFCKYKILYQTLSQNKIISHSCLRWW